MDQTQQEKTIMTARVGYVAQNRGFNQEERQQTLDMWLRNKDKRGGINTSTLISALLNDEDTTIVTPDLQKAVEIKDYEYLANIQFLFLYVGRYDLSTESVEFKVPAVTDHEVRTFHAAITHLFVDAPEKKSSESSNVMTFSHWTFLHISKMVKQFEYINSEMQTLNVIMNRNTWQGIFDRLFIDLTKRACNVLGELNYFEMSLLSFLVPEDKRKDNEFVKEIPVSIRKYPWRKKNTTSYFEFDILSAMAKLENNISGLQFKPGPAPSGPSTHPFFVSTYRTFLSKFASRVSSDGWLEPYKYLQANPFLRKGIIKDQTAINMTGIVADGLSPQERLIKQCNVLEAKLAEIKLDLEEAKTSYEALQDEKNKSWEAVIELKSKLEKLVRREGEAAT